MDAGDQRCVSHVNLGHGFQRAVPHGEGVQLPGDVTSPHLTVTVAHAQQVRAELGNARVVTSITQVQTQTEKNQECPRVCTDLDSPQVFPGPAVVYGSCAVLTPVDDVLVIGSKAHDVFMEAEALYQGLSSCGRQQKASITRSVSATQSFAQLNTIKTC